jgi:hypothetical protein
MSYDQIAPMRQAFRAISHETINTSMRQLLLIIASYPNGCFIGYEALTKECGFNKESTLKSNLNKCTKLNLIDREQKFPREGVQQCYRVNLNNLLTLGGVTLNDPSPMGRVDLKPAQGLSKPASGFVEMAPYKDYKNNKTSKDDLFNSSLSFIPANKRFVISEEVKKLLNELEHRGTTLEAIEAEFRHDKWESIHNPKAIVTGRLRDMVARPVRYTSDRQPPKCAHPHCDPVTRTFTYAVENPGEGKTMTCPECNFFWVNKRNGYY